MKLFFRNNGLTLAFLALFLISIVGQYLTGINEYNEDQVQHGQAVVGYAEYLVGGHFIEATFENWESEFLQMGMYVILTIFLFQKGSSESREPGVTERVDLILESSKNDPRSPWPVRRGGWVLKIYENSLSLMFLLLFAVSFVLHAYGSSIEYNEQQAAHGAPGLSLMAFLGTSRFWFESFQNWQSEFLSIGAMVYLSVYLRQKGSPESKAVDAPYDETAAA